MGCCGPNVVANDVKHNGGAYNVDFLSGANELVEHACNNNILLASITFIERFICERIPIRMQPVFDTVRSPTDNESPEPAL